MAAGLSTGEVTEDVAGIAFMVLGLFLYGFLLRFTGRLSRKVAEAQGARQQVSGPA